VRRDSYHHLQADQAVRGDDPIEAHSAPEFGAGSQFALDRLPADQAVRGDCPIEAHSAPELGAGSQLGLHRLPAEKDLLMVWLLLADFPLVEVLLTEGLALALLATRRLPDPGPSRLRVEDLSGFRIKLAE